MTKTILIQNIKNVTVNCTRLLRKKITRLLRTTLLFLESKYHSQINVFNFAFYFCPSHKI